MRLRDGTFEFRLNMLPVDVKEAIVSFFDTVAAKYGDEAVYAHVYRGGKTIQIDATDQRMMDKLQITFLLEVTDPHNDIVCDMTVSKKGFFGGKNVIKRIKLAHLSTIYKELLQL